MPIPSDLTFAAGTEIAGHFVLAEVRGPQSHLRLRARDGQGRGHEVAVAITPGGDEAGCSIARHHAQRLAGIGHPAFCVPTDVSLTEHGLVTIRPWFDTLLSDGLRAHRLSARQAVEVVIDLARALEAAAGRGLSHGAISPSNIAIDADGRGHLIDAAPAVGPAPDDLEALGSIAAGWLGDFDDAPWIGRAIDRCAAAATGGLDAADLAEGLEHLLETLDATRDAEPPVPPPLARPRPRARAIAAAALVAAAAAGAVAWATTLDGGPDAPALVASPPEPCREAPLDAPPLGAEAILADLYAEDCSVEIRWWPSRAEAEIVEGPATGRFRLGQRGDDLLLGDWDGDGDAEPALYRPTTGELFTWSSWPVDGAATKSTPRRDTGIVGGEPRVVVDGSSHDIEVVKGSSF
jgi:hypothetical protein